MKPGNSTSRREFITTATLAGMALPGILQAASAPAMIFRAKSAVANDDRTAFQDISKRLDEQFGLIERGLAQ